MSESLAILPAQPGSLDLQDFQAALETLPEDQKEALLLVGASGFSYEEAAQICGTAPGTVKSRVSRARTRLNEILAIQSDVPTSQDPQHLASNAGLTPMSPSRV